MADAMTTTMKSTPARWYLLLFRTVAGGALPLLAFAVWWSASGFSDGFFFGSVILWPLAVLVCVLAILACHLSAWFRCITYTAWVIGIVILATGAFHRG
jgi:hypothetical protein